jgi:hypothetical protein
MTSTKGLSSHSKAAGEGSQRLCLRPVPLQVEPAQQVVPIVSLPGRSARHEKVYPLCGNRADAASTQEPQIVTISLARDVPALGFSFFGKAALWGMVPPKLDSKKKGKLKWNLRGWGNVDATQKWLKHVHARASPNLHRSATRI